MNGRARAWCIGLCAVAATLGCSLRRQPDQTAQLQRAIRAEAEFARFGNGRYHVITFAADPERELQFPDDFEQPLRVYEVPFTARVRFTAALDVPHREQWQQRVGQPGWSVHTLIDDAQMALVFGSGPHGIDEELDVEGAVMFDWLENGWRFRCLDRVR